VEREVMDLYRALYMRKHIGDTFEGSVSALTGGGLYLTLDDPFVDVLVRYESLGPDSYRLNDEELAVVGARSGDRITLGDRLLVTIEEASVVRRAVFAKRVVPEKLLAAGGRADPFARPTREGRGRGLRPDQPAASPSGASLRRGLSRKPAEAPAKGGRDLNRGNRGGGGRATPGRAQGGSPAEARGARNGQERNKGKAGQKATKGKKRR
jgi:ribonuclease R